MNNPSKITIEDFTSKEGLKVKITYHHFYGGINSRSGYLVIDQEWAYVYDKGKKGSQYNGAFELTDKRLNELISIEVL